LLNLVEAWAAVKPESWQVVIAGQDENGHQAEVEAAIRERQLQRDFSFVGPIDGPAKWDLYRSADLFVLPSHTENFGLAVAEALACGLPVITTRGTPWEDLATHHCGWWIELGAEPFAQALREATTLMDAERQEMGRLGHKLVADNYTWPAAARKMLAVYRWMLGHGERPECVEG
jgi:glycosyltransferase involved in cell wall biosynthesis